MADSGSSEKKSADHVQQPRPHAPKLERIRHPNAQYERIDEDLDRAWSEWETTFDAIQDSIMLLDREFNIIQANVATSRLLGRPLDEIVGNKCCRLIHGTDEPPEGCPLSKTVSTKKRHKTELYIPQKDIWAFISVDPILDEQGNVTGLVHLLADITDHKKADEALRESQEHFRNIFENAVVGLYRTTPDGRILLANPALVHMLGYASFEELARRNLENEGFEPDYPRSIFKERIEADGQIFGLESAWTKLDGTTLFVRESAIAVRDASGNILYYEGTVEDITDRKKAEDALQKSVQLLRDTGEMAKVGGWELDLSTNEVSWTEEVCRIHGVEPGHKPKLEEAVNFYAPESRPALKKALKKAAETGEPYDLESLFIPSGSKDKIWVRSLGKAVYSGGKIVKLVGTFQNIDKYKRAEQQVRQSEEKYKELFESASEAIIIMDLNGKITDANRIVEEYGSTRDQLLGKSIFDFIPVNHRVRAAKDFDDLCHGTPVKGEMEVLAPKGSLTVEYRDNPIVRGGQIVAVQAILMDITHRKRAEQALRDYQARLQSLAAELALAEERERRRIAAGIHDDIGQKLALAKMELQLLAGSPGKSKIPASLDSVCARIDEAIKDAHSLTFELSNPALYDLGFEAAIELWLLERIEKKHGIKCTVIADEQAVPLDENSKVVLFRALRELAVNVVKHAKAAALTVTIEKLENAVQITCKDDGLGFTPPEDNALPRDVGGFGLFNIKERLEHLGGSMRLESAPGRGTLITLSLPAAAGLPLERKNDADADKGRQ